MPVLLKLWKGEREKGFRRKGMLFGKGQAGRQREKERNSETLGEPSCHTDCSFSRATSAKTEHSC